MISEDTLNTHSNEHANHEKNVVALSSVIAAIFLTGFKLLIGIATGSLGILSEAAHSGLDLVAAAVTLIAVRFSGRPADDLHTYGHGKIENLSALFETVLLLATCVWIIYEAIDRLLFRNVVVELSIWAFAIVIVAIGIDWTRSRALARVAKKYDSQALEADALHFSTDIWSSLVVLGGLFCVLLGKITHNSWLEKADAVAALGVSGIVIYVSIQLGKRTVSALLDGVPASLRNELIAAVRVSGVSEVKRLRVRRSGPESFADICLVVTRDIPLVRAHDIAEKAEEAVRRIMPGADVVVHIDPDHGEHEDVVTRIQALANQHGLGAHGIRILDINGARELELHLEVKGNLKLLEAHELTTRFEHELRKTIPGLRNIVTHIEPYGESSVARQSVKTNETVVVNTVKSLPEVLGIDCRPHNIKVHKIGNELAVSFHVTLDPELSVTDVHDFTERAEQAIRAKLSRMGRVMIHTEPGIE